VNEILLHMRTGLLINPASVEELAGQYPGLVGNFRSGLRSMMCVPLISSDEVIGALHFRSKNPNFYKKPDLLLAEKIGSQIAGAIANAQLYRDLHKTKKESERYSKQLAALHRTGLELTSELNLKVLLESIAQCALDLIGGLYCNCYLYNPEEDLLERVAIAGSQLLPDATRRRRGEGFSGHIWAINAPFLTNDYHSWPGRYREYDSVQPRALVGTPIHWGEEFLGVLNIGAYLPRQFTSSDVEILTLFSMQAATAIRNARLYDKIEQLAVTDELTGLLNRRGFFQLGEREFERALRFKRPLAALMFDIDHFKVVNDAYGHAAGDEVLQALAACFRQNSRGIDVAGRYGGEEFALLVPEILFPEAIQIAERLRQSIADLSIPIGTANGHSPPTVLHITTSIGAAFMLPDVSSLTDLVDRSDQALYRAKASGRNRVAVWEETKAHEP
jgi:diguanylate cyclase (GGDEF)-like protein